MIQIAEQEPRFLGRRFIATLLDYLFFTVLIAMLTFPLSATLNSAFRGGVGLFNLNRCAPGQMSTTNNQPIRLEGWDAIQVCDTTIDFVFPYRTGTIIKKTVENVNGVSTNMTRYLSFPLNEQNQIVFPFQLSLYAPFLLVFLAAMTEYFLNVTPGKKVGGLLVKGENASRMSMGSALLRNALKYSAVLAWSVWSIASTPFAEQVLKNSIQADGTIKMPGQLDAFANFSFGNWATSIMLSIALTLLLLIVPLSLFFPWRETKRGIHDRVAKTRVIRD